MDVHALPSLKIAGTFHCCERFIAHDVIKNGEPKLWGSVSSQEHICAMEYWQLIMTCVLTCPNKCSL